MFLIITSKSNISIVLMYYCDLSEVKKMSFDFGACFLDQTFLLCLQTLA